MTRSPLDAFEHIKPKKKVFPLFFGIFSIMIIGITLLIALSDANPLKKTPTNNILLGVKSSSDWENEGVWNEEHPNHQQMKADFRLAMNTQKSDVSKALRTPDNRLTPDKLRLIDEVIETKNSTLINWTFSTVYDTVKACDEDHPARDVNSTQYNQYWDNMYSEEVCAYNDMHAEDIKKRIQNIYDYFANRGRVKLCKKEYKAKLENDSFKRYAETPDEDAYVATCVVSGAGYYLDIYEYLR